MKRILVVGGAGGIGLGIATEMARRGDCEKVYVVDKAHMADEYAGGKTEAHIFDLASPDYGFFDRFADIDALMVTAGFGRTALFRDVDERHIVESFSVNALPTLRLVKRFYHRLESPEKFHFGVMVSIAGFMSSPFFAVYAATKAALRIFIESVNVELERAGTANRILNVSPGALKGTGFGGGGKTDLMAVTPLAREIISHLEARDDLFIPRYEEVFKEVLERYHADFRAEGRHSYDYKLYGGRSTAPGREARP